MNEEPKVGQLYRVVGTDPTLKKHHGRVGTATSVSKLGRYWLVELSNIKDWGALGIPVTCSVYSSEISPVLPAQEQVTKSAASPVFVGSESDLVAKILKVAEEQGYKSLVVGQRNARGAGTTVGYPDLSFRRPSWPRGLACLIEVKVAGGAVRKGQELLHQDGWSYVVWSVEEAISALTRFENEVFGR